LSSNISDKDKRDWDTFVSNNETLPNKDINFSKVKTLKIKSYDLHGLSLEEANNKIDLLINNSYEEDIRKLIIVTGKGIHSQNEKDPYVSKKLGLLRYSVPEYIYNNKELMKLIKEIKAADIKDGGDGAFYVYLKKKL